MPTSDSNSVSLRRRLLSGTAWALGAKFFGLSSSLIVSGLLARMLSPEQMGAYFLTVSITMFAAIAASFGLRQTVVRLIAESLASGKPGRAGATLKIVGVIASSGAVIVSCSYYTFAGNWLSEHIFNISALGTTLGLTACWIIILTFQTPIAEVFRGIQRIGHAVFLDGILANVFLAVALALLFLNGTSVDYGLAVFISTCAAAASLAFGLQQFWSRRTIFQGDGHISVREVLSISSPLFVTNLAVYCINQLSLWIVASNLVAEDVALFGSAWRLVNLVALPLSLINMNVNPLIAELHTTRNHNALQHALRGTATVAAIPAFVVLLVYMFFGSDVLTLVFGTQYNAAVPVLQILSVGMLANVWTGSCSQVLAMTGHQRVLMYLTVVSGLISSMFALLAVNHWGLIGVAVAVSAGRVFQNISGWVIVYRLTGLWTHGTCNPVFIKMAIQKVTRKG